MKKCIIALSALLLVILSVIAVSAGVVTTAEPTNGSTVYIAGNPDMFPIEYYDENTKEYRGILPEMYRSVSERSGYDFSYISAGEEDEQNRLAGNEQVEMVSAHQKGSIDNLAEVFDLTTISKDGEEVTVSIGFTAIASSELIEAVKAGVSDITASDILSYSAASADRTAKTKFPVYLVVITAAAMLGMIVFILLFFLGKKKDKKRKENNLIDPLTGIGNEEHFGRPLPCCTISPISRSTSTVSCSIPTLLQPRRSRSLPPRSFPPPRERPISARAFPTAFLLWRIRRLPMSSPV